MSLEPDESEFDMLVMDFSDDEPWEDDSQPDVHVSSQVDKLYACLSPVEQPEEINSELDDENDKREDEDEEAQTVAIDRLEDMTLHFLTQLCQALGEGNADQKPKNIKKVTIELADRRKSFNGDGYFGTKTMTYPRKAHNISSCKPFAQLFKVVDLMHEALVDNVPTTKRDVYYKDVPLFKHQAVVDKLVDDIAATAGLGRSDMNIRASSKGLFFGAGLVMHLRQGEMIYGNAAEATLIPVSEEIVRFEVDDDLAWVLIVEKEAVFQTLIRLRITSHPELPGHGIVITGKGYPDVATRQLVCTLSDNLPDTIPILALVDADPYGIDILSVYRYGSAAMSHESETLAAPGVKWAGVFGSELASFGIDRDSMIAITRQDEKKAMSMLGRPQLPKKWRRELQHMLFSRRKAEIEILSRPAAVPPDGGLNLESGAENPLLRYVVKKICRAVTQ